MLAAIPSRAGGRTIAAAAALAGALALAGCSMLPGDPAPAISPELIQASQPGGDPERPAFFVQWKTGGMPGLSHRPTISKDTKPPAYPQSAIRSHDEGTTSLESCVTVEGRMVDIRIAKSSGSKILDDATMAWAKAAKYEPAEFNGEPFAVCGYKLDYQWVVTD